MDKWLRLLVIVASFLGIFALLSCVLLVLHHIPHTLVLFSLGLLFAYAIDPLVEWLRKTKIGKGGNEPSREASVAVVMIGLVAIVGIGLALLGGFLVKQTEILQHDFPSYRQQLFARADAADSYLKSHSINFNIRHSIQHPPPQIATLGARVGGQVLPLVGHFFGTVAESAIVLLIALYFLIYCREMREKFSQMLPNDVRVRANAWMDDCNRILGGFVRGQLLLAIMIGTLAAIGCLAIGIHLWLIIGLVVVAASLIPVFGPYIGIIPAVLAAIVGPTHFHSPIVASIVVIVWFVIINELGSKVLYPKFVGEALGLHAVFVLFVLFAGLEVAGVLGVLFAAPLTALAGVTVVHLYRMWQDLPDAPLTARHVESVPAASSVDARPATSK